ncbi:MAG: M20/M25/M40 family metallo-hydrolase [Gemmatimonadaceae bacterium]
MSEPRHDAQVSPPLVSVNPSYVLRVLNNLIAIDSVNPSLVPGARGEGEIARYIASEMEGLGLTVRMVEPAPGRPSVVGRLAGKGGGPSLMLNGHADTVAAGEMHAPFVPRLEGQRLYGRGAYDMKGAVAACLGAVKAIRDSGVAIAGDVLVVTVADEEYASTGMQAILEAVQVDAAIVTEPTSLDVCVAHKGFAWIEVETRGRAAHGSQHALGVDANARMGRILVELERLDADLAARAPHPLLGRASLHVATLAGGSGMSTYSDRCQAGVERRTLPGETGQSALAEIQRMLDRVAAPDPDLPASARLLLAREPFEVDGSARIVRVVTDAASRALGRPAILRGENPWMDAALLAQAGVETVVIGPHGFGAHGPVEWVDVDSVNTLSAILAEASLEYCGQAAALDGIRAHSQ